MAYELEPTTVQAAEAPRHPSLKAQSKGALLLVCSLLVVHLPLILNNGLYGDDWLLFEIKPGYQTMISFLLHGAGHPITYLYCALANLTGHPTTVLNAIALAGIAIGALSLRSFLARLRILGESEILLLVFLVWTYAGFRDWATKITAPYIFSFALLCLGLNLMGMLASSSRPHLALRLSGLTAIFCSFAVNSMIPVFLTGLMACLWLTPRRDGKRPTLGQFVRSLLGFWDFLAIPVVYWTSTNYLFPKIGPYHDYYRIRIPALAEASSQLLQFLRWGTYEPALDGLRLAFRSPGIGVLCVAVGTGLVALAVRGGQESGSVSRRQTGFVIWPIAAGILLFFISALPYISVGIAPTGHFYESRHLLLFGLPLGLTIISAIRIMRLASNSTVAHAVGALIISVNLCALWNGYFFQQARWVRQSAMIDQLRLGYAEPPAAVFNLEDGFLDFPGHTFYGITEVTGGLHLAWDNRPLLGFTGRNENPTVLQEMDAAMRLEGSPFRNMDLRGPQATIEFVPKLPILRDHELSFRYYQCLASSCRWHEFLNTIASTTVRVGAIKTLAPLDHKADLNLTKQTALTRSADNERN